MKYRIKIVTHTDGRKEYYSYVKDGWGWENLNDTSYAGLKSYPCHDRQEALDLIDRHHGNIIRSIDFEYITK